MDRLRVLETAGCRLEFRVDSNDCCDVWLRRNEESVALGGDLYSVVLSRLAKLAERLTGTEGETEDGEWRWIMSLADPRHIFYSRTRRDGHVIMVQDRNADTVAECVLTAEQAKVWSSHIGGWVSEQGDKDGHSDEMGDGAA